MGVEWTRVRVVFPSSPSGMGSVDLCSHPPERGGRWRSDGSAHSHTRHALRSNWNESLNRLVTRLRAGLPPFLRHFELVAARQATLDGDARLRALAARATTFWHPSLGAALHLGSCATTFLVTCDGQEGCTRKTRAGTSRDSSPWSSVCVSFSCSLFFPRYHSAAAHDSHQARTSKMKKKK